MGNKLALVVFSLSGGAGRMMLHLAEGLAEEGWDTQLLSGRGNSTYLESIPNHVQHFDLRCRGVAQMFVPLVRFLRGERPDVVLSTSMSTNLVTIAAARCSGTNTAVVVREASALSPVLERMSPLRRSGTVFTIRRMFRHASVVIAQSGDMAEDLRAHLPGTAVKIHHIPNPTIRREIFERSRIPVSHRWLGKERTLPVISTAGRLADQKDHRTLLQAVAILRDRGEGVRLIIMGDGPRGEQLKTCARELQLEEHVDFLGFVDNPYPIIALSSAFVLSSRWEGLPNALIEAMALGVPVASTDCPSGPAEILDKGRYGPLVSPGDPDALATAITHVLCRPHSGDALRRQAELFRFEDRVADYSRVLAAALEQGSSSA
jgi:glycosyltransferase involved in cell wall biosynthesis